MLDDVYLQSYKPSAHFSGLNLGGEDETGNKLVIESQATSEPHTCIITGPETE
jgi:hypothetical protein